MENTSNPTNKSEYGEQIAASLGYEVADEIIAELWNEGVDVDAALLTIQRGGL